MTGGGYIVYLINFRWNVGYNLGRKRIRKAIEDSSSGSREVCLKAGETSKATKHRKVIENGHEGQEKTSPSRVDCFKCYSGKTVCRSLIEIEQNINPR